jgi:hypothetical protein
MKLSLQLTDTQAQKLRDQASRLGIAPEQLAQAVLVELLDTPGAEFRAAAEQVLRKNAELYRRLA